MAEPLAAALAAALALAPGPAGPSGMSGRPAPPGPGGKSAEPAQAGPGALDTVVAATASTGPSPKRVSSMSETKPLRTWVRPSIAKRW